MPLPYTGNKGESNFEADLVELLTKAGWEKEILKNKTVPELIDNWKNILFERNRRTLNNIPLSIHIKDVEDNFRNCRQTLR